MASIGNLALKVTADARPLTKSLDQAKEAIGRMSSFAQTALSAAISPLGMLLGVAGGGLSVAGLVEFTKANLEAATATAKMAVNLGITSEAMAGLGFKATVSGLSAEDMSHSMGHLMKHLAEAAAGATEATDKFERLGLNGKELAGLPLDEAFAKIADRLKNLSNENERARALMELFGRSGRSMAGIMRGGSEGLRQAAEEAKKLGLSFNEIDAAKVRTAHIAVDKLHAAMSGVGVQMAIAVAPALTMLAEGITGFMTQGDGMAATARQGLEKVYVAGGLAIEVIDGLAIHAAVAQGAFDFWLTSANRELQLMGGLLGIADEQSKGFSTSFGKSFVKGLVGLPWMFDEGEGDKFAKFQQMMDKLEKRWKELAKQPKGGMSPSDEMDKKVKELNKSLEAQVATFGMTGSAAKIYELAQEGATAAQLAQANALNAEMEALKQITELQTRGVSIMAGYHIKAAMLESALAAGTIEAKGFAAAMAKLGTDADKALLGEAWNVFERTRTPMEQMQVRLENLRALLAQGLIDPETAMRDITQAQNSLLGGAQTKLPSAIQKGSAADFSATARYELEGTSKKDLQAQANEILKQLLSENRRQSQVSDQIARGLGDFQQLSL